MDFLSLLTSRDRIYEFWFELVQTITNRLTLLIASVQDILLLFSLAKKFEYNIVIRLYYN